jgi:hypothetical protein
MVADDRDMIYGYFNTEEESKKHIRNILANNHSYKISNNYFIIEIGKIMLVNTKGEENA